MKIKYFLLLFPVLFFSQKTVTIKLSESIKDNTKTFKSLTVIDNRGDKEVGTITLKRNIPFRISR
jgi:hypothetical protein